MQIIISGNGGWCHVEKIAMTCPVCNNSKFTFNEGDTWIGHDKREIFMIANCDNCGKELDISISTE
jgi:C4-type Zn-finger protein